MYQYLGHQVHFSQNMFQNFTVETSSFIQQVVREFREGGYNTLVSTCVGEEGLDIGDVDLIVCYDAHKSPIRLVQRMGRTGRKRQGRIVMLMTEGKEASVSTVIGDHYPVNLMQRMGQREHM